MNFIRRLNRRTFFLKKFSNLVIYYGYDSWQQMPDVSSICPKLCLLGKKTLGHSVNTTLIIINPRYFSH